MFVLVPGAGLFMSSQKPFFCAQFSTPVTGKSVGGFADVCNKTKVVFVGQYPHRCGVRVGATSTWNKAGRCFLFVVAKDIHIDLKDTFKCLSSQYVIFPLHLKVEWEGCLCSIVGRGRVWELSLWRQAH